MSNSTKTKVLTVDFGVSEADKLFSNLSMTGIGSLYCDADDKKLENQDIPANSSNTSQLQNDAIDSDDNSSTKDKSVKILISKDFIQESSNLNDSISEADFGGFDLSPVFMSTRGVGSKKFDKDWIFSGPNFEKYNPIASGERPESLFGSSIHTDKPNLVPGDGVSTESDCEGITCDDEEFSDWSYELKNCSGDDLSDASANIISGESAPDVEFGLEFDSDGDGEMSPFVQALLEYFKTGNNEETGSVEKFIEHVQEDGEMDFVTKECILEEWYRGKYGDYMVDKMQSMGYAAEMYEEVMENFS
eukprot:440870_1